MNGTSIQDSIHSLENSIVLDDKVDQMPMIYDQSANTEDNSFQSLANLKHGKMPNQMLNMSQK